jgi:putative Holliday junction resolvase
MRILALDPGERRIGIAVSDELEIAARGLDTFDRKSDGSFFTHLGGLIKQYGITEIVVGFPLSLSGEKGDSAKRAEDLASKIGAAFPVTVTLWDERLSSKEAERVLRGSKSQKGTVDKVAAILILQNYLDYRSDPRESSDGEEKR